MFDPLLLLKVMIVVAGCYAVFWEIMEACRMVKYKLGWRRIALKFGFAIMALYWSGYYLRSIVGIDIGSTHQVWVRAPLLITIMLIGASASHSWFRHR